MRYVRGDGIYTKASRAFGTINRIVVHATDGGSLGGNIWWLSGHHSHASAHAPKPAPPPVAPTVAVLAPAEGQTVSGTVGWQASPTGPVVRVDFLVDGSVRGTATAAPWTLAWDTSAETPGTHRVTVRAFTAAGRSAEANVTVSVAPSPAAP